MPTTTIISDHLAIFLFIVRCPFYRFLSVF